VTTESIARVVSDVKRGLFRQLADVTNDPAYNRLLRSHVAEWAEADGVVVDANVIYKGLVDKTEDVALYEDHPCIIPPWKDSSICFENEHGNVVVMVGAAAREPRWPAQWKGGNPELVWDDVRWIMTTLIFVGGRGGDGPTMTMGPCAAFQYAIDDDGEPLDIHWIDFVSRSSGGELPKEWDMALLVHLGTLNFMNARNIDIVEPTRPRPQAKRIARTGVRVHELRIFPTGKSTRSRGEGQPLTLSAHGVRGHFAHYGACCAYHEPRGLLFGKYEGKVYVPPHVRGSEEVGEISHEYTLLNDGNSN
jgi:hypothetical protein